MATLNIIFTRETMIDGTRSQTRRYSNSIFELVAVNDRFMVQ